MATQARSKTSQKVRSLSTKSVSSEQARGVRGGFTASKHGDKASSLLFQNCVNGKHYTR